MSFSLKPKKFFKGLKKLSRKLGPVGEALYDIGNATTQGLIKGVMKDPTRLLTGVDPVSTKLWNAILGTNKKSLVNMTGGPTGRTLDKIGASSLTRGVFKVADTIAAYFGTMGAASGLGNAFSSMSATGGVTPVTGQVGNVASVAPNAVAPATTAVTPGAAAIAPASAPAASGGMIGNAMRNPLVQSAAIGVGGKLVGGVMADRAEVKDRKRYNTNVGTELWPG